MGNKMEMFSLYFLIFFLLNVLLIHGNPNGLGMKPPMGWNTWCTGSSCHQLDSANHDKYPHTLHDVCNEGMVKEMANVLKESGMQALGYNYVNLDDCWQAPVRDSHGNIQPDYSRFPYGMKDLVDWLHERGFKFGLYNSAGWTTCAQGGRYLPIPGSYGFYQQDADVFASWDVDYVKFDWCGTHKDGKTLDIQTQTTQMAQALNKTGRPMWFNFHCPHAKNKQDIPPWCQQDGNSYRIGPDHHDNWPSTSDIIYHYLPGISKFAGPGHWNDPDFLMTGGAGCDRWYPAGNHCPGQTETEYYTEFTIWAITNSALIISTDLRNMTDLQKKILMNKELIDINQDVTAVGDILGYFDCKSGPNDCQIWGKVLADGSHAVALFNGGNQAQSIVFDFKLIGKTGQELKVRDLWKHQDLGTFNGNFKATVASHGTVAIKLSV